jgi:protoheme ferro-lyase
VSFCSIAWVNRAGYYRWLQPLVADAAEADLRDAIQRIALEFPAYDTGESRPNGTGAGAQ